jgi:anti-sigma regulatory factor (Ser/Thr protein kinase)/CheY-like chemotaxis protein
MERFPNLPPQRVPPAQRVLVVEPDRYRAAELRAALRAAGHPSDQAADLQSALRRPLAPQARIALELPDGCGLELFLELRRRQRGLRAVLVGRAPSFEIVRRAWRAGAVDVLSLESSADEQIATLLGEAATEETPTASAAEQTWTVDCDRGAHERLLRELCAVALARGFGPAARARLCTAAGEALENARLHGYGGGSGPIEVELWLDAPAELRLVVADRGRGCEARQAELDSVAAALPGRAAPGGLLRMRALCDRTRFESTPQGGTRVELVLRNHPAACDAGDGSDLSDLDYLAPERARSLVRELADPERAARLHLPPALAITAGRLLASTSPDRRAQRALWS